MADAPKLFTVASTGRSGTAWYAQLLSAGHSYCFHNLTSTLRRYPVNAVVANRHDDDLFAGSQQGAQRRLVSEGFSDYFARLFECAERGYSAVGNSDPMLTPLLSGLWLFWPDMRFLFSFRDGVTQVESTQSCEADVLPVPRAIWEERYGQADYFELCCRDWVATVAQLEAQRDWLREHGAETRETRLERVATDVDELREVWEWLAGEPAPDDEQLETAMRTSVSPGEAWAGWNDSRRQVFTEICGDTQRRLGYALPVA